MENRIRNSYPILQFTAFAQNDIEEIWRYLGEVGNEVAEKMIRQIIKQCESIAMNPKMGRERNDLIINLRQFPFKNYNIYYFPLETGIEIYRVLHGSRDNIQIFDQTIDEAE
jgi:toxin ParE1/3/4